jgi:Protein of unknown function (DUF1552)
MFLTKKSLPRRTFLRGAGAVVALPMLDAMTPAASAATALPPRLGFIYVPHGADLNTWTPVKSGTDLDLSPTLKSLEPFKNVTTVITNLKRGGTVVEMHAGASSGWLSGAIPKRTEGEDYGVGETIDQVLAKQIGQDSPFPSLEFATEDFTGYVGGCAPGYSCAYMNTISWATATTPLPMEINPRIAFERLFGDGGSDEQRKRAAREDSSILDAITAEARLLETHLGVHDKTRVNDYLDNVREIERRIQQAEVQKSTDLALIDKPLGIPESFEDHTALMFDLLALAFHADLTRVFTFMMSRESSYRTFPQIGVSDPWHVVSHHGDQPEKVARAAKINVYCVNMFVRFLERMRSTPDREGSLLDRSLLFYGSGMGNSNVHATDPLPMLAVGGGLRGNRHLLLPKKTEIGNLWLTVANRYGIPLGKFGESTATIESL